MAQTSKGPKKVYVCSECDYQSAKWMGRCPSCNAWNSFVEETYAPPTSAAVTGGAALHTMTSWSILETAGRIKLFFLGSIDMM